MLEIKFRAWDEIGEWMGDVTSIDFDERTIFMTTRCSDDENCFDLDKTPIMQYTGIKDKNGKEICEGDVVEGWKESSWHDGKSKVFKVVERIGDTANFNIDKHEMENCEVIGNIYKNPELLEESQNGIK